MEKIRAKIPKWWSVSPLTANLLTGKNLLVTYFLSISHHHQSLMPNLYAKRLINFPNQIMVLIIYYNFIPFPVNHVFTSPVGGLRANYLTFRLLSCVRVDYPWQYTCSRYVNRKLVIIRTVKKICISLLPFYLLPNKMIMIPSSLLQCGK